MKTVNIDRISINNEKLDRRVKLTSQQKKEIIDLYSTGDTSYRKLAKAYKVSPRLIGFVLNPDKLKKAKEQLNERRKDGRYYDRKKHSLAQKEHRQYKKSLLENGMINYEA